ncbi:MAG: phosphoribosylglycinamide formyltransferase [Candidatus Thorarchaeota archaeon]
MKRIGVLISGRGSNLQALIDAQARGELGGEIVIVLSNKSNALGLERARKAGIPTEVVTKNLHPDREKFDRYVMQVLDEYKVELVVLAGFMRILSDIFVKSYTNKIINVHPSLLPSFKGVKAQWQAIEHGVKIAGCSTHFVTSEMDDGPVILQKSVPVFEDDTGDSLASRILPLEHSILVSSVRLFCEERLRVDGRRVRIIES